MPTSRPSGLGITFLVPGVLLLVILVLVGSFTPLVLCSGCSGWKSGSITSAGSVFTPDICMDCEDRGKVSLVKKWKLSRTAPAR